MPILKNTDYNPLTTLFKAHKKALHLTSDDLGNQLGIHPASVRRKMLKGIWSSVELKDWCEALDVSPEELGNALMK